MNKAPLNNPEIGASVPHAMAHPAARVPTVQSWLEPWLDRRDDASTSARESDRSPSARRHIDRAVALLRVGEVGHALESLVAARRSPEPAHHAAVDAEPYLLEAACRLEMGQVDRVIDLLETLTLTVTPGLDAERTATSTSALSPCHRWLYAGALLQAQRFEQARDVIDALAADFPHDTRPAQLGALLAESEGDAESLTAWLRRWHAMAPGDVAVRQALAFNVASSDPAEAISLLWNEGAEEAINEPQDQSHADDAASKPALSAGLTPVAVIWLFRAGRDLEAVQLLLRAWHRHARDARQGIKQGPASSDERDALQRLMTEPPVALAVADVMGIAEAMQTLESLVGELNRPGHEAHSRPLHRDTLLAAVSTLARLEMRHGYFIHAGRRFWQLIRSVASRGSTPIAERSRGVAASDKDHLATAWAGLTLCAMLCDRDRLASRAAQQLRDLADSVQRRRCLAEQWVWVSTGLAISALQHGVGTTVVTSSPLERLTNHAIDTFESHLAEHPTRADGYHHLACCHHHLGETEEAELANAAALAINPRYEAAAALRKSLRLAPRAA